MDNTDFEILKLLQKDSKMPFQTISKKMHLSRTTVKQRIEHMVNEGVIISFEVSFNPSLLGLQNCINLIKYDPSKSSSTLISNLESVKQIHFISCSPTNKYITIGIHYYTLKELENNLETIGHIEGIISITPQIPPNHLSTEITLSQLDWKIISILNHNARKKNHEVAKELGVSTRTISRRINKLHGLEVIKFRVLIDFTKVKGFLVFVLSLRIRSDVNRKNVLKQIKQNFPNVLNDVGAIQSLIGIFMYVEQISDIESILNRVKDIPGVIRARSLIYSTYFHLPSWFDNQIKNQIYR